MDPARTSDGAIGSRCSERRRLPCDIFKLCGSHSYLAARRDSWQLIDELRQG